MTPTPQANPPDFFDARAVYEKKIEPIARRLVAKCFELGIPATLSFTVAHRKEGDELFFTSVGATVGSLERMSVQHILAAALSDPKFADWIAGKYADFIALTLIGAVDLPDGQGGPLSTSVRMAAAAALMRDPVTFAIMQMMEDVQSIKKQADDLFGAIEGDAQAAQEALAKLLVSIPPSQEP